MVATPGLRRLESQASHLQHPARIHVPGVWSTVDQSGFHSPTRPPEGESVGMVVAAPEGSVVELALQKGCSTKFTTPGDPFTVEQGALI